MNSLSVNVNVVERITNYVNILATQLYVNTWTINFMALWHQIYALKDLICTTKLISIVIRNSRWHFTSKSIFVLSPSLVCGWDILGSEVDILQSGSFDDFNTGSFRSLKDEREHWRSTGVSFSTICNDLFTFCQYKRSKGEFWHYDIMHLLSL